MCIYSLNRFLRLQQLAIFKQLWMGITGFFFRWTQAAFDQLCRRVVSMKLSSDLITGNPCLQLIRVWPSMFHEGAYLYTILVNQFLVFVCSRKFRYIIHLLMKCFALRQIWSFQMGELCFSGKNRWLWSYIPQKM